MPLRRCQLFDSVAFTLLTDGRHGVNFNFTLSPGVGSSFPVAYTHDSITNNPEQLLQNVEFVYDTPSGIASKESDKFTGGTIS